VTNTSNMVSVNRRFMPFLNRALEWARKVGPIQYVHCTMARHARTELEFIWATAVHAVDTLRYINGDVTDVAIRRLNPNHSSNGWYGIDLVFQNGGLGRIDVMPTAGMGEETYDLFGQDFHATVTCPLGRHRGWCAFRNGVVVTEEVAGDGMSEDLVFGFYDEAWALIHLLGTGKKLKPTIADVAPSVELCMLLAEQLNATKS
jgi:predicted dehydrogenase